MELGLLRRRRDVRRRQGRSPFDARRDFRVGHVVRSEMVASQ